MPRPPPLGRHRLAIVGGVLLLGCSPAAGEQSLGGYPVCEASGALALPCPGDLDRACLLVADNEVRDDLFLYPLAPDGRPVVEARRRISLDPVLAAAGRKQLSDIEALARHGNGEILVYGSHSRNRDCDPKKHRRLVAGLELTAAGAVPGPTGVIATRRRALLESIDGAATGLLASVRTRIEQADALAEAGDCSEAFNLEGAVALDGQSGEEVWVGLRSPRLDGHAVLLRHDLSRDSLHFDAARLVDLRGEGIRALGRGGDHVYGTSARPGSRSDEPFRLWRFPSSELTQPGTADPIAVEEIAAVPHNTEGIAVTDQGIVLVTDGEARGGRCIRPATTSILQPRD